MDSGTITGRTGPTMWPGLAVSSTAGWNWRTTFEPLCRGSNPPSARLCIPPGYGRAARIFGPWPLRPKRVLTRKKKGLTGSLLEGPSMRPPPPAVKACPTAYRTACAWTAGGSGTQAKAIQKEDKTNGRKATVYYSYSTRKGSYS